MHHRQKIFKDFLEKLTHFVVENSNDLFYFLDFIVPFQVAIGQSKAFMGRL